MMKAGSATATRRPISPQSGTWRRTSSGRERASCRSRPIARPPHGTTAISSAYSLPSRFNRFPCFLLSARRDAEAAKRFFRKALGQPHTVNPRTITVDKNAAYPKAIAEMKQDGELWRRSRLRQVKYLNNIVEQDHRNMKRLIDPGLGFGGFWTARRTLAGYETMAMIRKGQVRKIGGNDIKAQAEFIVALFQDTA